MLYDMLIIGGGPAGLSAALILGRALKTVALFDGGPRRNARAHGIHGFVSRDGIAPSEFRAISRQQLGAYKEVQLVDAGVDALEGDLAHGFRARANGTWYHGKRVLLATGLRDALPPIPGLDALWGETVFSCPYCHGYAVRRQRWGMLAIHEDFAMHASMLRGWTDRLTVLSDGAFTGPGIDARKISRLEGHDGRLRAVHFESGAPLELDALVLQVRQQQVPLVQSLGLQLDAMGFVTFEPTMRETSRPGIHVAGDMTTFKQGALVGAADGAHVAYGVVRWMNTGTR